MGARGPPAGTLRQAVFLKIRRGSRGTRSESLGGSDVMYLTVGEKEKRSKLYLRSGRLQRISCETGRSYSGSLPFALPNQQGPKGRGRERKVDGKK